MSSYNIEPIIDLSAPWASQKSAHGIIIIIIIMTNRKWGFLMEMLPHADLWEILICALLQNQC